MGRRIIPDNNTEEVIIDGDNKSPLIVGKNNCGRIIIKGGNYSSIRIGEGNKAEICIEDDNEPGGVITVGDNNTGKIKINDVNEGQLEVGDNNCADICIGNDNEGQIKVGDGNKKDIKVGDVNEGSIIVGNNNQGDICIEDDNERIICVGDDNDGNIEVGDVNQGSIKVGARNCGDINVTDDNEGTISTGNGDQGHVNIGDQQEGTVERSGCDACRAFFDDYDVRFQPAPPPALPKPLQAEVKRLVPTGILVQRYRARRDRARGVMPPPAIPAPNAGDKVAIRALSDGQKKLFEDHFKKPDGSLDCDCIEICFNAFANGELRNPGTPDSAGTRPGEPDGDFFFLFAEYALLAIECNSNKDLWEKLLPAFVAAQEIFIDVYPPISGLGGRRAFRGPAVDKDRKKLLHEKYAKKNTAEVTQCYEDNLKKAAGQPQVALRAPTARELAVRGELLVSTRQLAETLQWLVDDPFATDESRRLWAKAKNLTDAAGIITLSQLDKPPVLKYFGGSTVEESTNVGEQSVTYLEGISSTLEKSLSSVGAGTLSALARINFEEIEIKGMSSERLQLFRNMARLKLAFPELDEQDIEVLVEGLDLSSVNDIKSAQASIRDEDIIAAMKKVKLPKDYEPYRLQRLLL